MARTSKKAITIDDLLQESNYLLTVAPYQIPQNWCWVQIGSVAELFTGDSINETIKQKKYAGQTKGLIYIATKDIGFDGVINYETNVRIPDHQSFRIAPENTPLLCVEGGSAGRKIGFTNQPVCFVNKLCAFVAKGILSKYIYYYLVSQYFFDQFNDKKHGLIGGVSVKELSSITIAIPPLAEQQRIVDRIESLFAKLDEAKEKAQAVIDGYEDRKAAILHKAFAGELTKEWREKNKITFSSWVKVKMQDVCEKITCGKTPKQHIATEGEVPFLKVYNIVNNKVDFETTPQYIPLAIHKGRLYSSILKPNDVIMNIVGPPLRKIAIIPNTYKEWNINQAIVRFRPKEGLDYRYLYYSLVNPETLDDVIRATKGVVGQANISVSQSRNLEIMLPSMEEQQEVVRLLDMLIEKGQKAKEAAERVIDQIDTMKKSILARAFRGELGTNDPTDEPAIEVLKKALANG